jgi:hypothetical protein
MIEQRESSTFYGTVKTTKPNIKVFSNQEKKSYLIQTNLENNIPLQHSIETILESSLVNTNFLESYNKNFPIDNPHKKFVHELPNFINQSLIAKQFLENNNYKILCQTISSKNMANLQEAKNLNLISKKTLITLENGYIPMHITASSGLCAEGESDIDLGNDSIKFYKTMTYEEQIEFYTDILIDIGTISLGNKDDFIKNNF